jgi:hypothetical protein
MVISCRVLIYKFTSFRFFRGWEGGVERKSLFVWWGEIYFCRGMGRDCCWGGGGVYTFWFNVLVRFRPFRIPLDVQLVVREDLQGSLLHLES